MSLIPPFQGPFLMAAPPLEFRHITALLGPPDVQLSHFLTPPPGAAHSTPAPVCRKREKNERHSSPCLLPTMGSWEPAQTPGEGGRPGNRRGWQGTWNDGKLLEGWARRFPTRRVIAFAPLLPGAKSIKKGPLVLNVSGPGKTPFGQASCPVRASVSTSVK